MTIYACATGKDLNAVEKEFDGKGYGDLKQAVGQSVIELLTPVQEEHKRLMADKAYLDQVMADGADRAEYLARRTLRKVYKKVGLIPRP